MFKNTQSLLLKEGGINWLVGGYNNVRMCKHVEVKRSSLDSNTELRLIVVS